MELEYKFRVTNSKYHNNLQKSNYVTFWSGNSKERVPVVACLR